MFPLLLAAGLKEKRSSRGGAETQSEDKSNEPLMMDFPGELPISVYQCASGVEYCIIFFVVFVKFVVNPFLPQKPCGEAVRPKPFDEAHDQDHPAKPREEKHSLTSP